MAGKTSLTRPTYNSLWASLGCVLLGSLPDAFPLFLKFLSSCLSPPFPFPFRYLSLLLAYLAPHT